MNTAKNLYNNSDDVWPEGDNWHKVINKKIQEFVETELRNVTTHSSKILNIGSGGTLYNTDGVYYHIDIAEKTIQNLPNATVGSAEKLPYNDEMFDVCICVGSVINYCSPHLAINEMIRVMKKNGVGILEFERSSSAEFLFQNKYSATTVEAEYNYNKQIHRINLYSDDLIKNYLLDALIIKENYFHSVSSLMYFFTKNQEFASFFSKIDFFLSLRLKKKLAHNRIILFTK